MTLEIGSIAPNFTQNKDLSLKDISADYHGSAGRLTFFPLCIYKCMHG